MRDYSRQNLARLLGAVILHPFGAGDLASDGVQYSDELTTSSNDYETVEKITIDFGVRAKILEVEFGLTCKIKSSGATEGVKFKWQARNQFGTWVDLHSEVTYAADASAYAEYTMSGRFVVVANFNSIPCELQLLLKTAVANGENALGMTKNSSYVAIILDPMTSIA